MSHLRNISRLFAGHENGQALVEYGLILSLIAVVAIAGVAVFAGGVGGLYDVIAGTAEAMQAAMDG